MTSHITTFYKFNPLLPTRVKNINDELYILSEKSKIKGLIILGLEGINGTVSSNITGIQAIKSYLSSQREFKDIEFKDSTTIKPAFKRFKIKEKDEIVTLERPDIKPHGKNSHLTPEEWHQVLSSDEDFALIDTRNWYESDIGKFKNAITPNTEHFKGFKEYLDAAQIPKEKKVLMYCTGGIRCEKASIEMQERGYESVFQLQGGILKYLEEFKDKGHYEGECFVFDNRVAVDTHLKPTKLYSLCPFCGNPGDKIIKCKQCSKDSKICEKCSQDKNNFLCSKNCKYHYNLNSIK